MSRATRVTRTDKAVAVGILVVGVAVAGFAALPASASGDTGATAEYLSAYAEGQTARDRLPAKFPVDFHGDGGLDASTSRFLGELEGGISYWSVVDKAGELCLVVDDRVRDMTAAGCGDVSDLEKGSIALAHELAKKGGLQAFLVADGFARSDLPEPWTWVGDNLVVVAQNDADGSTVEVSSGDRSIELTQFAEQE